MHKRRSPTSKLSLLRCAIALAASGVSQSALAIDLCTGDNAVTIASSRLNDNCTLDTTGARLTVTGTGKIGNVNIQGDGVKVSNSGLISGSSSVLYSDFDIDVTLSNSGRIIAEGSAAYAAVIYGDVNADIKNSGKMAGAAADSSSAWATGLFINGNVNGNIINSGTIKAQAISTSSQAYASGIDIQGILVGDLKNSGRISATATAPSSSAIASALYLGEGMGPDGRLMNSATIKAVAIGDGGVDAAALELGAHTGLTGSGAAVYASMFGNASLVNSGRIVASASAGSGEVAAKAINVLSDLRDSASIRNRATGTIRVTVESASADASITGIRTGLLRENSSVVNNGRIVLEGSGLAREATIEGIRIAGSLFEDALVANNGRLHLSLLVGGDGGAGVRGISTSGLFDNSGVVNTGAISVDAQGLTGRATATGIDINGIFNTGSLSNAGTIKAFAEGNGTNDIVKAFGINASYLSGQAALSNSGGIVARGIGNNGSAVRAYGIMLDDGMSGSAVTFVNSGQIDVSADGRENVRAYGIRIADGGLGGIDGQLRNSGRILVRGTSLEGEATAEGITSGSMNWGSILDQSGTIDVRADGYSQGIANGIWVSTFNNTVTNSGTITVAATDMTNTAIAHGLRVSFVGATGVVTNSGHITVTSDGLRGASASAYGLASYDLMQSAQLLNTRIIFARATSEIDEASARGIQTGGVSGTAGVMNSGMVRALAEGKTGASAYGLSAGALNDTGSASNSRSIVASALIHNAGSAAAMGLRADAVGSTASISNFGTLIAVAEAESASGSALARGIQVDGLMDGVITNTGTIDARSYGNGSAAGIFAGSGSGLVQNSGVIFGGVSLGGAVSLSNSGHITTWAGSLSTVGGDYIQSTDGLLTMQVRDAGTYASLTVGGEADFTASDNIHIIVTPDVTLVDGSTLANVISAGTLTTDLDGLTVTDSSLFWNFTGVMDGNTLDLDVDFAGAAAGLHGSGQAFTASQLAFADAVLLAGAGGTYNELSAALNGAADAAAAADALESVGPGLPGAAAAALRSMSAGASNAISARQGEIRGAAAGDAFTQNALWLKPFIGQAEQDSVDGVDGYDVDSTGFVIGLDGDVSESWRLGVAVASGQGEVGGDKVSLDVSSTQLSLYGSYAMSDSATLDLNIDHMSSSVDSTRRVALANTSARASYDASQFALGATVSNRVAMGEKHVFIPSLQARYQRASLDGYTETGAGLYDLTVESSTEGSLLWAAEGAFEFGVGKGTLLASAGLGYDTLDAASLTSTLSGSGPTFVSNGIKPDSTVITGGLGYRHVTAKNLEISVAYDMESRGDFVAQTASVKFKLPL